MQKSQVSSFVPKNTNSQANFLQKPQVTRFARFKWDYDRWDPHCRRGITVHPFDSLDAVRRRARADSSRNPFDRSLPSPLALLHLFPSPTPSPLRHGDGEWRRRLRWACRWRRRQATGGGSLRQLKPRRPFGQQPQPQPPALAGVRGG